jgi:hypothetical protein
MTCNQMALELVIPEKDAPFKEYAAVRVQGISRMCRQSLLRDIQASFRRMEVFSVW